MPRQDESAEMKAKHSFCAQKLNRSFWRQTRKEAVSIKICAIAEQAETGMGYARTSRIHELPLTGKIKRPVAFAMRKSARALREERQFSIETHE